MNENLAHTASKTGTHGMFWLQHSCAIVNRRQERRRIRRSTHKLLQEVDVEHIMETGAFREGEADNNVVDELGDAVGTIEARLQLPFRDAW